MNAYVFIIPNSLVKASTCLEGETRALYKKVYDKLGLEKNPDQMMVQVWISNTTDSVDCAKSSGSLNKSRSNFESSSWQDQGVPYELLDDLQVSRNSKFYDQIFPNHLPVSLFIGKKEGDIVYLDLGSVQIKLHLAQKDFRYGNHGSFEEVLERLLKQAA